MITAVVALGWAVLVVAGLWRLRTSGTRYVPSGRSIGAVGDRSLALNDRMAAVAHVHGDRESTTGAFGSDRRWPVWSGALRRWALLVSRLGGRGVTQPTLAYRSGLFCFYLLQRFIELIIFIVADQWIVENVITVFMKTQDFS